MNINSSFLQGLLRIVKKVFQTIFQVLQRFDQTFPTTSQNIQFTFIYFFAFVDLTYAILNSIFSFSYFPEYLLPFYPLIEGILSNPILQIFASPEKIFFLSYVVIELMIIRTVLNFSKLIKYNVLLIFALLMMQGLAISYWDVLFHREISTAAARWAFDKGVLLNTDKEVAILFFLYTFLVFSILYIYLYYCALQGKFAVISNLEWLTDSVAFWLRIKTPTMRMGKKSGKNSDDDDDDLSPEEDDSLNKDE